ncbi:MAG: hypothetical protein LQ346_000967 [Caloplaca aetnensis]|nr:MAG: hypothetical protein LQ346_000967 [Caloplaca aetnensis]
MVVTTVSPSCNGTALLPHATNYKKTFPVEGLIKLSSSFHVTLPTVSLTSFVTPPGPRFGKSNIRALPNATTPLPPKSKDNETCSVHDLILLLSSCHITKPLTPLAAVEDLTTRLASWSLASCQKRCASNTQSSCHRYQSQLPRRRGLLAIFPAGKNARNVRKQKGTAAGSEPSVKATQHIAPKPIPSTPLPNARDVREQKGTAAGSKPSAEASQHVALKPIASTPLPATAAISPRLSRELISQLPPTTVSNTSTIKPPYSTPKTTLTAMDHQAPPEFASKPHPSISADASTTNPTPSSHPTRPMAKGHKVLLEATSEAETSTSHHTSTTKSTQSDTPGSAQSNSAPPPVQSNHPTQPTQASTAQQAPSVSQQKDDLPSPIARANAMVAKLQSQFSLLSISTMKRTSISQDSKVCGKGPRIVSNTEPESRHCILQGIYTFTKSWCIPKTEEQSTVIAASLEI